MTFNIGKIGALFHPAQNKIVSKFVNSQPNVQKAAVEAVQEAANKNPNSANEILKARKYMEHLFGGLDARKSTEIEIPSSEVLKAQFMKDFQYPLDGHYLGCGPDDWMIQEALKYVGDLSVVREKIKNGTLDIRSDNWGERRLAAFCKKFGQETVLAELNAKLEGFTRGSNPHQYTRAMNSATAIAQAHGWKLY